MTTQRSTVEQSRQGVLELGCGEGDATQATRSEPLAANGQAVMVCQDNIEFMRGLPDASIKLIVTSPPYNLGKSYEERSPLDVYIQSQETGFKARGWEQRRQSLLGYSRRRYCPGYCQSVA